MDGTFGPMGGSSAGGDSFGYYTGTPTPGASAPTGPFGAAPAPAATAFGAPQAPYASQPGPTRKKRGVPKVAIVLIAVVVLGVGFAGWNGIQRSRPIVMPATFSGLPVDTDAAARNALQGAKTSMMTQNPGMQTDAQAYGSGKTAIIVLAARGRENVDNDIKDPSFHAATAIGANTCAQQIQGNASICARSEANLTVVVVMLSGTPSEASLLVDQAWALF